MTGKFRILIIESDADFAGDMAAILGSRFEVTIACSSTDRGFKETSGFSAAESGYEVAIVSIEMLAHSAPEANESIFLVNEYAWIRQFLCRSRSILCLGAKTEGSFAIPEDTPALAVDRFPEPEDLLSGILFSIGRGRALV